MTIEIFLLGIASALLSYYFQVCISEGMIFSALYKRLKVFLYTYPSKNKTLRTSLRGLYKILGGCIYCNGFYISLLVWYVSGMSFDGLILPYVGVCGGAIHLINMWLNSLNVYSGEAHKDDE